MNPLKTKKDSEAGNPVKDLELLAEASSSDISGTPSSSSLPTLKTRHDAYRQLERVAGFLEKNDPHSPAHQLLRQLIRWENKNILDIFGEISQTPQDLGVLMKLLGSVPGK